MSKKLYEQAKSISGLKGRAAFNVNLNKDYILQNSHSSRASVKRHGISTRTPSHTLPPSDIPDGKNKNYIQNILGFKKNHTRPRQSQNVSIATRQAVRSHPARLAAGKRAQTIAKRRKQIISSKV